MLKAGWGGFVNFKRRLIVVVKRTILVSGYWFLVALMMVVLGGVSWGAVTLEDVARDVSTLKVEIIKLSAQVDSIRIEIGRLYVITLSLFGALAALFAGLLYFVFDISRSLRVPKEERVAALERKTEEVSKMKQMIDKLVENMKLVNEKLHLPRIALVLLLLVTACWLLVTPSHAVPMMINVQGRLTDRAGSPITSSIWLTFRLYTVPTGGTEIWASQYLLQPDSNGIFNVNIGGTGLPEFLTDDYYLEVLVGEEKEKLGPRQRLVSVPFAITARNVKGGTVEATTVQGRIFAVDERKDKGVVRGENYFIPRIGVIDYYGIGVEGRGAIGVYGYGPTTGGSFESESGYGAFAKTDATDKPAVYGDNRSSGSGVRGDSATGFGVSGLGGNVGVVGTTRGGGTGVYGGTLTSVASIGVWGVGSNAGILGQSAAGVGVQGTGSAAGGSFESSNIGVYGKGDNYAGKFETRGRYGVYGKGVYGIYGEGLTGSGIVYDTYGGYFKHGTVSGAAVFATSESGVGVYGSSGASDKAGVYVTNTGVGPALELGEGGIRLLAGKATQSEVNGSVIIDNICGEVKMASGSDRVQIFSKYFKEGSSIIFASAVGDAPENYFARVTGGSYWLGTRRGFGVSLNRTVGSGHLVLVHFLIINTTRTDLEAH